MAADTLKRRTRVIIPVAEDNGPTPERRAKGDYEWDMDRTRLQTETVSPVRRVPSKPLQRLYNARKIDDDALSAGNRWYRDYAFSQHAHLEVADDVQDGGYERGNLHTWHVGRAKSGERVSLVAEMLTPCGEDLLKMLLIDELSFSEMGRRIFPGQERANASRSAEAQCILVLTQLPFLMRTAKKAQDKRLEDQRRRNEQKKALFGS